jgi:hypothetical protein
MPTNVRPMLATLVHQPFDRRGWLFEIKWDGYRVIAEVDKGQVRLYSRNGRADDRRLNGSRRFGSLLTSLLAVENTHGARNRPPVIHAGRGLPTSP